MRKIVSFVLFLIGFLTVYLLSGIYVSHKEHGLYSKAVEIMWNYMPADTVVYEISGSSKYGGFIARTQEWAPSEPWSVPEVSAVPDSLLGIYHSAYDDVMSFEAMPLRSATSNKYEAYNMGDRVLERTIYPVGVGYLVPKDKIPENDGPAEYWYWLLEDMGWSAWGHPTHPRAKYWLGSFVYSPLEKMKRYAGNRYYEIADALEDSVVTDVEPQQRFDVLGFNEYYGCSTMRLYIRNKISRAIYLRYREAADPKTTDRILFCLAGSLFLVLVFWLIGLFIRKK